MENGFSTADAVLTSAMSGGFGNGAANWGNRGCAAPFADPASNAVRINRNADVSAANDSCTRSVLGLGLDRLSDQAEESRRSAQFTSIRDGQFQAELRNGDRLRDIEREIAANAKIAAQCCCDLKLQSCEDKAEILAAIADSKATALAVESRGIERSLNAANAELTALKTQIACGCCPSPS